MHALKQAHWSATKHLIGYLKHTISYGLFLYCFQSLYLTTYLMLIRLETMMISPQFLLTLFS